MALFGYDYSGGASSGFNPWYIYDNPRNTDGYYDYSQDSPMWENNGRAEDSRARVWRWTLDDLRAQGVSNPGDPKNLDAVRRAYLNNVARLRRDIESPDNAGRGLTWAKSGFAGYDKFLAPDQTRPLTGGQPQVKPPPAASQPPTPPPAPPPVAPSQGLPPSNPGVGGGLGSYNGVSSNMSAGQRGMLSDDPELAFEYLMRQQGMNPDISTRFSQFFKNRFSPLLQASLAASAIGDNSNYGDVIDQLINNFGNAATRQGGSFFGDLRRQADMALQSPEALGYLGGIKDQNQVMQYLAQLAVARYAGANPMVQQSIADQIEAAQRNYNYQDFTSGGKVDPYLEWLRNSKYAPYLPIGRR